MPVYSIKFNTFSKHNTGENTKIYNKSQTNTSSLFIALMITLKYAITL